MTTLAITGVGGLLGFHLRALIHARFRDKYDRIVPIHRDDFRDEARLAELLSDCDGVVHLAARILGDSDAVLGENQRISSALTKALEQNTEKRPHLVFASSTHIDRDTAYGQSKREASDYLSAFAAARGCVYTPIVFPNVFGENGLPFHNSVVSTFCFQLRRGGKPEIQNDGMLSLLHAQRAAQCITNVLEQKTEGVVRPEGIAISVSELLQRLSAMEQEIRAFLIPDLSNPFDLDLYNTLRSFCRPEDLPVRLTQRSDERGTLFETVKTKHGGQAFASVTKPHVTRGNHFHLHKLERFCVLSGEANISIRKLFSSVSHSYHVYAEYPCVLDIPTMHTHSIENVGETDLLTLFWAHEVFDPDRPDTYPEPVSGGVIDHGGTR